ncbi:MAG TPA: peptide deformylase [Solirubrobacteraceae bacterium]|nr:peptide deformylase [Solirubrobacteraceae bacterium]
MPDAWIRQWGDPVLHERARLVDSFDDLLRAQAARLSRLLDSADGAGLAATQVGVLRRMFAFRVSPEEPIEVIVNPSIVAAADEYATFVEGCLSYNSVAVAVRRPVWVQIRGQDVHGEFRERECSGFAASLMQHEIDHLDGVITLDRADPSERARAVRALTSIAGPLAA